MRKASAIARPTSAQKRRKSVPRKARGPQVRQPPALGELRRDHLRELVEERHAMRPGLAAPGEHLVVERAGIVAAEQSRRRQLLLLHVRSPFFTGGERRLMKAVGVAAGGAATPQQE